MARTGKFMCMVLGASLLLATIVMMTPSVATAQGAVCELDWDCNGEIDYRDAFVGNYGGGFYWDIWFYLNYSGTHYHDLVQGGIFHKHYCNGQPGNMDWDGNGVINMADAYLGDPDFANFSNGSAFWTQYRTWKMHPEMYSSVYPNSDCISDVSCNYHSDCAADEYCAGDGCSAELVCDPYLPDGVCTPKRDAAECATAGIAPTCGCDSNFYLNQCELEVVGVRYQGDGLCTPLNCTSDADCPCGLTCVGDMAKQCLPG